MKDEPRSTLSRYAYGYSDKKPGWVFWLILVGMIVYVLYSTVTIVEAAECLNRKEARREWPGHSLSWRGKRCWYSRKAEREAASKKSMAARAEVQRLEREKEPLPEEDLSVPSPETPSSYLLTKKPLPEPKEVLLVQSYLNRKLEEDKERDEKVKEAFAIPVPAPVPSPSPSPVKKKKNWKEEEVSWPALLGFAAILTGAVFVAGGFGLFRRGD